MKGLLLITLSSLFLVSNSSPALSWPKVILALPQFVLDKTSTASDGLGTKVRGILEKELRSAGLFTILQESIYTDLEQRERNKEFGTKKNTCTVHPKPLRVDLQAWDQLGAQLLIKTEYKFTKGESLRFAFLLYDVVNKRFLIGKRYKIPDNPDVLPKMIKRYVNELELRAGVMIRNWKPPSR